MAVRRIIYVSTASPKLGEDDLFDILTEARERNDELGITGLLIFGGESFTQILEGPEEALELVYGLIVADLRHLKIHKVEDVVGVEPRFKEWSMAFAREESFILDDRRSIRRLRKWVFDNPGSTAGDPGILEFATRCFLDTIARLRAGRPALENGV